MLQSIIADTTADISYCQVYSPLYKNHSGL